MLMKTGAIQIGAGFSSSMKREGEASRMDLMPEALLSNA